MARAMVRSYIILITVLKLIKLMEGMAPPTPSAPLHSVMNDDLPKVSDHAPIIGYDCNKTDPEVLTMSALEVGPCPSLDQLSPNVRTVRGQIIQKREYHMTVVRTCQFTKSTFYFKCAKNWYNYQVYPPSIGTIITMTPHDCDSIHKHGSYKWSPYAPEWTGLISNKTYQRAVNEVGWTDNHGYCEGGTYTIANQVHTDVVVQASLTLSIRESWSTVDIETGKINIENVVACQYTKGSCFDAVSGTHVWSPSPKECPEKTYTELYKGSINITGDLNSGLLLISINRPPFLFSAELGTKTYTCGLTLQLTEFPSVFFLENQDGMYQGAFEKPSKPDIEFITYLNAKLTFSYHNLINSAQTLFYQAMMRSCEIERDVLKNRIEIIRLTTSSGALSTLLQGGMFARANGEVLHVLKCEPIPVQLRNTQRCYDALPILVQGDPKYLLPNTHIIAENASEIPCTPITPITYKIGGKWWAFTGTFQPVNTPQIIHPRGIEKMEFVTIRSFSRGGMYSMDQIEAVQKMFSFPNLREAITTNLAAGITNYFGRPIPMDITNVMSKADMESIAQKNLKRMWGIFSSIGNAISGLIGIYFVFRLIKGVLNTLLDAKELYGAFGVSMRLFAALWSRLALYFLNQARNTARSQQTSTTHTPPSDDIPSRDESEGEIPIPSAPLVPVPLQYKSVFSRPSLYPLAGPSQVHDTKF